VPKLQAIALQSAGLLVLVHGAVLAAELSLRGQALPSWTGVVTHVVDGDTVYVRPVAGGAPRSLRLLGMDAPEICQEGGVSARDALNERISQRQVQVQVQGSDDYGRDLVRLYLASEDVGQWMVQRGHAWSYRFRQEAGPYAESERHAQILRRGIYAGLPPENPRDFRRRHGPCPR
jgi:endonuclease YncB( thermonuclease family)